MTFKRNPPLQNHWHEYATAKKNTSAATTNIPTGVDSLESLSSVMKVRPQKPDHHQELKVTSSTKKATAVKSETKKNLEVSKIALLGTYSIFKNLNVSTYLTISK